jgi:hypothetical protein
MNILLYYIVLLVLTYINITLFIILNQIVFNLLSHMTHYIRFVYLSRESFNTYLYICVYLITANTNI